MTSTLRLQVCHNHSGREAIARCPSCGFFFCRECITEHDERILCASCLKRLSAPVERSRRSLAPLARGLAALSGVVTAWFFFYLIGRLLVATPTKFHEAALWKKKVEEIQSGDAP
jgi:hypothetical protein